MSENADAGANSAVPATQTTRWVARCLTVLAILSIGGVMVALMLPAVPRGRPEARRSQCKNNLKQIALALHQYEKEYHALPPAYTVDAYGNRLHSWRTLILPYIDQAPLYNTIDLSKPWDDPANSQALNTRLAIYQCPSHPLQGNQTTYLASAGPNGCFRLAESRFLSEITDNLSQTLMVIDAPLDRSVPWMSPMDADEELVLSIGSNSKLAHEGGFHAALCDGSVRFLSAELSVATRRALISIAGKDDVGDF